MALHIVYADSIGVIDARVDDNIIDFDNDQGIVYFEKDTQSVKIKTEQLRRIYSE